jgi:hypothetical protein
VGEARAWVDVSTVGRDRGGRGLASINFGDFGGLVLLGDQFVVCVEFGGAWGGKVAGLGGGGGIMVLGASSWSWPLLGAWGDGGLVVKQALN